MGSQRRRPNGAVLLLLIPTIIILHSPALCLGIRSLSKSDLRRLRFSEAPPPSSSSNTVCDPSLVHVAMTLDSEYLRGSTAAVHSVLKHASCPGSLFFHLVAAEFDSVSPRLLSQLVRATFPSLSFRLYIFREDAVINLISSSIRPALESPLNYARSYLGDILDACVTRVIYLDHVGSLWRTPMGPDRVIGAPEYCHANFTASFWSDPELTARAFSGRACYFNTGVMLMDLAKWRAGDYRRRIEGWMEIQKKRRIYQLGSLPPFLLVFGGNVEPIDHRWNQHGLGGDNLKGSCRPLHPGPVSLLHWSGKGKPWVRLDGKNPCPLDQLWKPYDLYRKSPTSHQKIL